ncbi:TetR/AcrR family transcriptional regulator [Solirubrobacter soli]|uniref:TetR/AcrR family transcriptional regulator n=1 Tax=Solirubrobacter soli TaxID=363832 RepID=UPI000417AEC1|nr:TetR/AcrR family transcriptional regulator [Solirubrobacter soli]
MAATRPRTTTPEGREQRERILRAALRLFTAQGFRGASLDAVAAEVGISRQGVLHYFPSKTLLLLGVLDLRDETSIARAEERHETDFADGLIGVVADNQREPDLVRLYTVLAAESVAPEHPGHDHFQERYRGVRAALAHGIDEAQQAGELDAGIDAVHLATLLTAVMDGLQLQFLLDPESVDMVEPLTALLTLLRAPR